VADRRVLGGAPGEDPGETYIARVLWRIVETLDLSAFTARAMAVEGRQERDVLSVRMLLTLWLHAISEGALHVKAVFAEADDPGASDGEKRAREAAALDYLRRVEAAIDTIRELQAEGKEAPRASTTDTDARVLKMGDGGFRRAYNVQMATAGSEMGGPRTIVGFRVTNVGSDMGSTFAEWSADKSHCTNAPA
jgi:hypothetical protein